MVTFVNVKRFAAILALSGFLAATVVASANAAGDPRKCDSTGGHITGSLRVDGPTFCAARVAQLAFRRYMTAVTHTSVIYSAPFTCLPGATNLLWTCAFADGKGTIRFRALSDGWHTRVTVTCTDPAMRPAAFCST